MTRIALLALTLSAAALPAAAEPLTKASLTVDAGGAAIDAFAGRMDANHDGSISPVELDSAGRAVFASMDTDDNGRLSEAEMTGWRHGMADLAAYRGRTQAYEAALGTVFDLFDTDRSGDLDPREHADGIAAAWSHADRDADGRVSIDEFRNGFLVTTALRQALTD